VEAVELRRVRLRLVEPFHTAHGVQYEREILLVRAMGPAAEGWGECNALPEPTYTAETVDTAAHVLREHIVPRLFDTAEPEPAPVKGHPMAHAALEAALLDLRLRAEGRSLADFLGATRDRVPAGVAIGMLHDVDALADTAERRLAEGYQRIKLKVEPGWDVEPVSAVRHRIGPDAALQVDANGSYAADPSALKALDDFGLVMIEQPLADDDLLGHAALAQQLHTPICLDESITSVGGAEAAIALGACRIINIKPGRVGGLAQAKRIHDLCAQRGIPVWCGGMLETGIGRAASVALAALPNFTLPADLSASDRYYAPDLTAPFVLEDGCLRVPTGPGIGVVPDRDALAEHTVSIETITP
jgi:O-succinylbenzoate synthase